MTTITIERSLLEHALEALETVTDDYDDSAVGIEVEAIHAIRAALEAPATAPAWQDAPTVPGSYVLHCGNLTEVQLDITQDEIDKSMLTKGRWYGPIPADFDEKRWSDRADELLRIFDASGDRP